MKNIIKIACILLFINCKAQTIVNINNLNYNDMSNKYFKDINNHYPNFVGTWENTTGNITFRLILWKEDRSKFGNENNCFIDKIFGKYLILQNAGAPNEQILYNSVKYFPQSNTTTDVVLSGKAISNISGDGYFEDTNANNGTDIISAGYRIEILNLGSTPLQARWRIKAAQKMTATDSFTVPTDCIMTKVN